jgi:surface polysaccharide O-acyltransferase-like enzyme
MAPSSVHASDAARQAIVFQLPVLKGICVLAVILTHATASIWRPFAWPLAPEVFVNTLARFAVPLFVAMSGFYLSLNPRNQRPLRFYRRTLPGLALPYIVYTAVYLLASRPDLAHILRDGPGHLIHGTASAHLWFLPVIIELYLVHPFLRRWYSRSERPGRLVALAVATQVAYAFLYELVVRPAGPLAGWRDVTVTCTSFLKFVGYFVTGYYLSDNASAILEAVRRRGAFRVATVVWLAAGATLPSVWASQVFSGHLSLWSIASRVVLEVLAIPLTTAAFIMIAARPSGRRWPVPVRWSVRTCGLYSYGVYYLHPLVLTGVAWALYRHAGALMAPGPLRGGLLFLLCALVTVHAVKLLVRLPLTRHLA